MSLSDGALPRHARVEWGECAAAFELGQRERVVVVEVGATWLVLGVTTNQINTLHTLPAQALPHAPATLNAERRPIDLFGQKLRESLTGKSRPSA